MKKIILTFVLSFLLLFTNLSFAQKVGFTQEDRERLIRLEATLKVFMDQTNRRFEDVNKRLTDLREDTNKRFAELREDMNRRFEQMDRRFEQVDKRFDQMMKFLWMLVAIFTTLTATVIGFAYWDRRTIIRKARDEAIEEIEKEGRLRDLIKALRRLAEEDRKLADVLRSFGLL